MMKIKKELLPYKVGALMYVPALNKGIGKKLCDNAYPELNSLAFCLEDAITEYGVEEAEQQLVRSLSYIAENRTDNLPMLFVRVRNCEQFERLPSLLGNLTDLLTGVIFPKFDLSNATGYCELTREINSNRETPLFIMPILESQNIMNVETRKRTLIDIRKLLDGYGEYVLNVRVGAMDFCKLNGLRRNVDQTIYDIGVVRDVLTDVLAIFADTYVVSAPVWEYFEGTGDNDDWKLGLERELRLDITNGFIGKTVIHPSQILIVKKWLKPLKIDFEDAKEIINWKDPSLGVAKNITGNRMNELITHHKWAKKILYLEQIYGVRDV